MERYKLQPLTEEEKQMVEQNHNIVYAFLHNYGYRIEEFYGVVAVGFIKGVQVYCRRTRFTKKADLFFTSWSYMRTEVENYIKTENALKRPPIEKIISLDAEYLQMENLWNVPGRKSVEEEYMEKEQLRELMEKLTEVQCMISHMKLKGFNNSEICLLMEIPSSTYYKELNRIKLALQKYVA